MLQGCQNDSLEGSFGTIGIGAQILLHLMLQAAQSLFLGRRLQRCRMPFGPTAAGAHLAHQRRRDTGNRQGHNLGYQSRIRLRSCLRDRCRSRDGFRCFDSRTGSNSRTQTPLNHRRYRTALIRSSYMSPQVVIICDAAE